MFRDLDSVVSEGGDNFSTGFVDLLSLISSSNFALEKNSFSAWLGRF